MNLLKLIKEKNIKSVIKLFWKSWFVIQKYESTIKNKQVNVRRNWIFTLRFFRTICRDLHQYAAIWNFIVHPSAVSCALIWVLRLRLNLTPPLQWIFKVSVAPTTFILTMFLFLLFSLHLNNQVLSDLFVTKFVYFIWSVFTINGLLTYS